MDDVIYNSKSDEGVELTVYGTVKAVIDTRFIHVKPLPHLRRLGFNDEIIVAGACLKLPSSNVGLCGEVMLYFSTINQLTLLNNGGILNKNGTALGAFNVDT